MAFDENVTLKNKIQTSIVRNNINIQKSKLNDSGEIIINQSEEIITYDDIQVE